MSSTTAKKLNFKKFFKHEADRNIIGTPSTPFPTYKSLMKRKQGVKLDKAPNNKISTIMKKGKDHWMVDTGNLMKKGFKRKATSHRLLIYASGSKHSGQFTYSGGTKKGRAKKPPTYRTLFRWHNMDGYSGVFNKLPVGSQFYKRMEKDYYKQLEKIMEQELDNLKISGTIKT